MKKLTTLLIACLVICGWIATDLSARGGGHGGMAHGGASRGGMQRGGMPPRGMQRGGSGYHGGGAGRTPSMNHRTPQHAPGRPGSAGQHPGNRQYPSARPGPRPGTGNRPGEGARRAPANNVQQFLDLPGGSANARGRGPLPGSATARTALPGGAANAFLSHQPAADRAGAGEGAALNQRLANRAQGTPGQRPGSGQLAQHLPNQIENHGQWNTARQNRYDELNGQVADRFPDRANWFDQGFWQEHPNMRYPLYNSAHGGAYWWTGATWGSLNSWMPYGWSQPASYNYGDNVYYQGDQVYSNGQPVASADDYAQQAQQIATSEPATMPSNDDWMPLGVFAMTPDGQSSGAEPTMFMQLAVSKQGVIAGTYQNRATGSVQSIEGAVDKSSQRAAWTVGGKSSPTVDAGIVNLTQDSAPVLLHFADGRTQQWLLARLQPPQSGS